MIIRKHDVQTVQHDTFQEYSEDKITEIHYSDD